MRKMKDILYSFRDCIWRETGSVWCGFHPTTQDTMLGWWVLWDQRGLVQGWPRLHKEILSPKTNREDNCVWICMAGVVKEKSRTWDSEQTGRTRSRALSPGEEASTVDSQEEAILQKLGKACRKGQSSFLCRVVQSFGEPK